MINTDKIYCVNLDKRKDRWTFMNEQFEQHKLNVTRFSAVDGQILCGEKSYNSAVLGFNTSQIRVLEDAILNQYNTIMILEDDAVLHPHFEAKVNEGLNELPKDWNVCYLGGSNMKPTKKVTKNIAICAETFSTVGYMVNVKFARDIILPIARDLYTKKEFDAILVLIQQKFDMHIFEPRLVYQREDYSDIRHMNIFYSHLKDF